MSISTNSDGVQVGWSALNGVIIQDSLSVDSNIYACTYICTLSNKNDTLKVDTLLFMDSIQCIIVNIFQDSIIHLK